MLGFWGRMDYRGEYGVLAASCFKVYEFLWIDDGDSYADGLSLDVLPDRFGVFWFDDISLEAEAVYGEFPNFPVLCLSSYSTLYLGVLLGLIDFIAD